MSPTREVIYSRYADEKGRIKGKDGGLKNDKDKPMWDLLPFETIERIVKVMTYGAKKYEPHNWKKVEWERNFAALMRHLVKWFGGESTDPDSGFHHLDHALTDLTFVVWKVLDEKRKSQSLIEWLDKHKKGEKN